MTTEAAWHDGRQVARAGLITVQWVCLTSALSSLVAYSSSELKGMISPELDGSSSIIGALFLAALLGITVRSPKVLFPLIFLMCVAAACVYAAIILAPAWEGTIMQTVALRNFAINQMIVVSLLLSLPAMVGGLIGHLVSGLFDSRDELLPPTKTAEDSQPNSWWSARNEQQ